MRGGSVNIKVIQLGHLPISRSTVRMCWRFMSFIAYAEEANDGLKS
jgi:hypothetical protein